MHLVQVLARAVAAIAVAAIVSEIQPLPAWFAAVDDHRTPWLLTTGGSAVLGLILLMSGIVQLLMAHGRELNHAEAEDVARRVHLAPEPVTWRATSARVWGEATGRAASEEYTFDAVRQAWRSGDWRRDRAWRRRVVTAGGALLLVVGLFGVGFTLGPPPIKVLTGGALLYGLAGVARGLWRS